LGEIGDRAATRPLVNLLHDYNPIVSSAAADSLGAIADKAAVAPLIEILKDYKSGQSRHFQIHGFNRGLYMSAVQALERINTPEARRALKEYYR
jgi:HEAT repeat protein